MKVIAIDPGYDRVGFAVLDKNPKEKVIYSECYITDKNNDFAERIFRVGQRLEEIILKHQPDFCAIEQLFFSKNTKTALQVSEARGMMVYIAKKHGLGVYEYTPNQIKLAVTGYGAATKNEVFTMVNRLVDIPKNSQQDDEVDAIAAGLTFLACYREG